MNKIRRKGREQKKKKRLYKERMMYETSGTGEKEEKRIGSMRF